MTDSSTHEKVLPRRYHLMSRTDDKVLKQFQARYRKASKKGQLPSRVNSSRLPAVIENTPSPGPRRTRAPCRPHSRIVRDCVCWPCRSTRTPAGPSVRSVWKPPARQTRSHRHPGCPRPTRDHQESRSPPATRSLPARPARCCALHLQRPTSSSQC